MYEIQTVFRSWENGEYTLTYKREMTDNWPQAVGAFGIYVLEPDCVGCEVRRTDVDGYSQIILDYQPWID